MQFERPPTLMDPTRVVIEKMSSLFIEQVRELIREFSGCPYLELTRGLEEIFNTSPGPDDDPVEFWLKTIKQKTEEKDEHNNG